MKYILTYSITLAQCQEREIRVKIPVETTDNRAIFFRRALRAALPYRIQEP